MPRVSVLFPAYNTKEEYLRAAVESILGQTFHDFELLIINDASTDDNVEKVIKSYQDSRIHYFVNDKNMGISKTRNRLIDLAEGEYLAVMDHDDISLPTRLEKQTAYMDANPDIGVLSCQVEQFPGAKLSCYPAEDTNIKLALFRSCAIPHSASMIRKRVLIDTGIRYEEEFSPAEDYALWCRLIPHTHFYNLQEVLFRYRSHRNNTSKIQGDRMEATTFAIHSFMEVENPALFKLFLLKATHKTYVRLFGFIPVVEIVTNGYRTKIMLFNKIQILTYTRSIKLLGR